jgi:tRNA-splicing ligase RtcB (3'-phosphate/5'-hydroxy nucleic acid ligase)
MVVLKKISDVEWEIPVDGDMNVPCRIFSSEELMKNVKDDESLNQIVNVGKLPGILRAAYAMPDMHQGYGFPIGGVAAFDLKTGVISPGGVGYDINCSVRLLKTNLREADLKGREKEILRSLFRAVPSGVGRGGSLKLKEKELDEVLVGGAKWAVEKGYGFEEDLSYIEEEGCMAGADVGAVSQKAKGRGMSQLGSLGAGNHFLDVLIVDEVFDKKVAEVFGLEIGQVVILIHCGSRGLGHQVAEDYIKMMSKAHQVSGQRSAVSGLGEDAWRDFAEMGLACAPIDSDLGRKYFGAMVAAANFAFANKQVITHWVRDSMKYYFPDFRAEVVYDICHNIAKVEKHVVEGKSRDILVVRKGATRSFGPGREEIPEKYRVVGQPVLLPGSMGTASYILCGTKKAEEISWGSTAHGAGRVKSRSDSHKMLSFEEAKADMEKRGVFVEFGKKSGMVEESPFSYKDVDEVVRVSDEAGIGKKVAKLRPLLVVIG